MRRIALFVVFSFTMLASIGAQTSKENLEKAVEAYNATQTYQGGLSPKTITDDEVAVIKSRMDKGIALLDQVIREGNADEIIVARYFKTNFLYTYFFVLGMKGRNAEAYELNKQFEADISRYTSTDFPLSYAYFDKKYTIQWDNFSLTQAEYYTGYSEICYNLGKYPDAIRMARVALSHPAVTPFYKYIAINKIVDIGIKSPTSLSETEKLDAALRSMELYDALSEADKKVVEENKYPTVKRSATALAKASETDLSAAHQSRCASAAIITAKYDDTKTLALPLFSYCYKNKYAGTKAFHEAAIPAARSSFAIGTPTFRQSAQEVGDAAITALLPSAECEQYKQYAADYQSIGLASKGLELDKKFEECIKAREKAERRQQANRSKYARRSNRHFNVYLGVDVIPLLTSIEKMDFGGHIDFRGRRLAHSFGFSAVNQRRDYNSSRTRWDGNRYFYALKFFTKGSEESAYTGFYLGYADKTFNNLLSVTATSADGSDIRTLDITPVDKQYELMWNSGMQALGKPFGVDFWFGIGASYNQLSFKELAPADGYTFSGNDFFDNRKKLESINLKFRMGLSVGLNMGKKR